MLERKRYDVNLWPKVFLRSYLTLKLRGGIIHLNSYLWKVRTLIVIP